MTMTYNLLKFTIQYIPKGSRNRALVKGVINFYSKVQNIFNGLKID